VCESGHDDGAAIPNRVNQGLAYGAPAAVDLSEARQRCVHDDLVSAQAQTTPQPTQLISRHSCVASPCCFSCFWWRAYTQLHPLAPVWSRPGLAVCSTPLLCLQATIPCSPQGPARSRGSIDARIWFRAAVVEGTAVRCLSRPRRTCHA